MNLVPRTTQKGPLAKDMQYILLKEIRDEYNHNLSQQLYISDAAWAQVCAAMEETIMLINRCADELKEEAGQTDFVKKIVSYMSEQKYDTTAHALQTLKEEVRTLF